MQIRESTPNDISEIITVLKASLGEADLPISEEIWKFKHVNNPFGKSIVLLAEEDGRIAGVRAFMRWKWMKGDMVYSAFRAVDTATHPEFQGRGIFKKLTLQAVAMGIEAEDDFIFNTPNEKSRPGYLKMGWENVGNLKVGLQPAWNSFYKLSKYNLKYSIQHSESPEDLENLCSNWNSVLEQKEKIFTPKSLEFLQWRYENNPLQNYEVYATSDLYIAGYVKKRKNIKELRISECIFKDNKDQSKRIKNIVRNWSSKFGVQVISYSPEVFIKLRLSILGNFGPVLTVKNLNLKAMDMESKKDIGNWDYSLGDLELF